MNTFEKARRFIYRNARPLDIAVFRYHFENGSADDAVTALSAYQNPDGGFGWGLESDNFNPDSIPMGAWKATEYIKRIGGLKPDDPVIKGILNYLSSGADFDTEHDQWLNTVPTNNSCPCAVWWKYPENGSTFEYNPTAALAGFIIKYAEKKSYLYEKGIQIAKDAANWFINNAPLERHIAGCFMSLYDYCEKADNMPFDGEAYLKKLNEIIDGSICRDVSRWGEYIPRPSTFFTLNDKRFYNDGFKELCLAECEYIRSTQLPDGSFNVPWNWYNDCKEWYIAENWIKAEIAIDNMLFLREFDALA